MKPYFPHVTHTAISLRCISLPTAAYSWSNHHYSDCDPEPRKWPQLPTETSGSKSACDLYDVYIPGGHSCCFPHRRKGTTESKAASSRDQVGEGKALWKCWRDWEEDKAKATGVAVSIGDGASPLQRPPQRWEAIYYRTKQLKTHYNSTLNAIFTLHETHLPPRKLHQKTHRVKYFFKWRIRRVPGWLGP